MRKTLRLALAASDWTDTALGLASGILALLMVLVISYEVFTRYVLKAASTWGDELAVYLFIGVCCLSAGYATLVKAHVNLDIVVVRLPQKVRTVFEVISFMAAAAFSFGFGWGGWTLFWTALREGYTTSGFIPFPLAPIYVMIPIAGLLLLLGFIKQAIRSIVR